ncbi:MAG: hypothetical protein KDD55_02255 [Bdellovibrionales bacterium]|nr:hypothetical protein [Bdellovibrionales bacterium]
MQDASTVGGTGKSESFLKAKKVANNLGYLPSSFTTSVRTLIRDQEQNDASMRPVTKYQVARLMKTPSFKSMLYYATLDMRGQYIEGRDVVTVGDMMDFFEPVDIAALIACFVYFRKGRKMVPTSEWITLEAQFREESLIAAHLGIALPVIGVGFSLILGTVRYFALAAMLLEDEKAYRSYQNHLRKGKQSFDEQMEEELWGCNTKEVAVFMLSKMGFGVDIGNAFRVGVDPTIRLSSLGKGSSEFKMKLGKLWLDSFLAGLEQPAGEKVPGEYYPMMTDRQNLLGKIEEIRKGRVHWLARKSEDISPESTPQLFAKRVEEFEVPEELLDVFTVDQITAMDEDSFDNLVDHIDLENEGKVPVGSAGLSAKDLEELEELVS